MIASGKPVNPNLIGKLVTFHFFPLAERVSLSLTY